MVEKAGRDADNPVCLFKDAILAGTIACFTSAALESRTKRNDSRRKAHGR
jgi:hypothetical protein